MEKTPSDYQTSIVYDNSKTHISSNKESNVNRPEIGNLNLILKSSKQCLEKKEIRIIQKSQMTEKTIGIIVETRESKVSIFSKFIILTNFCLRLTYLDYSLICCACKNMEVNQNTLVPCATCFLRYHPSCLTKDVFVKDGSLIKCQNCVYLMNTNGSNMFKHLHDVNRPENSQFMNNNHFFANLLKYNNQFPPQMSNFTQTNSFLENLGNNNFPRISNNFNDISRNPNYIHSKESLEMLKRELVQKVVSPQFLNQLIQGNPMPSSMNNYQMYDPRFGANNNSLLNKNLLQMYWNRRNDYMNNQQNNLLNYLLNQPVQNQKPPTTLNLNESNNNLLSHLVNFNKSDLEKKAKETNLIKYPLKDSVILENLEKHGIDKGMLDVFNLN